MNEAALAGEGEPSDERLTLAQALNAALVDVLERFPETLVFGEDVAVKGGVYGVTRGLQARFGARRVFQAAIVVFTVGSASCGLAPSLPFLVAARIVQGMGGALMVPVGRLVMLRSMPSWSPSQWNSPWAASHRSASQPSNCRRMSGSTARRKA